MPRILHFGIGNFHRAHQAWYTKLANEKSGGDWRITGVSLRSSAIRDQLKPQNFAYTLVTKDSDGVISDWIDVHDNVLVAQEDNAQIIDRIADPETTTITLTTTEKGYHLSDGNGELDKTSDAVIHDLAANEPQTVYGFLFEGLMKRSRADAGPINVISCDNLPGNGNRLAAAFTEFCKLKSPGSEWNFEKFLSFPNTMVDRIVPATTDALREEVLMLTGRNDNCPVTTERFSEWYIEDRLIAPCPDWREVGVNFVADVAPFEVRKLRLLNGAHSYLAYAGLLAGYDYVHEAVRDAQLRADLDQLWDEMLPTLPQSAAETAATYCKFLLERFENPSLNHRLAQIAMDGSLKLPIRVLPVIRERTEKGLASPMCRQVCEVWTKFVINAVRNDQQLDDPSASEFGALALEFSDDDVLGNRIIATLGVI